MASWPSSGSASSPTSVHSAWSSGRDGHGAGDGAAAAGDHRRGVGLGHGSGPDRGSGLGSSWNVGGHGWRGAGPGCGRAGTGPGTAGHDRPMSVTSCRRAGGSVAITAVVTAPGRSGPIRSGLGCSTSDPPTVPGCGSDRPAGGSTKAGSPVARGDRLGGIRVRGSVAGVSGRADSTVDGGTDGSAGAVSAGPGTGSLARRWSASAGWESATAATRPGRARANRSASPVAGAWRVGVVPFREVTLPGNATGWSAR